MAIDLGRLRLGHRRQIRGHQTGDLLVDRYHLVQWGEDGPGVMLHRVVAADEGRYRHDHPWDFVSVILKGGYIEVHADPGCNVGWYRVLKAPFHGERWFRRMRAEDAHRIDMVDPDGPTWSLVLHGSKRRTWGFLTPDGWVAHQWYEYYRCAEDPAAWLASMRSASLRAGRWES
jgi:hypothetical protein